MAADVWHEKKSSSWGTQTMWCGQVADSDDVTNRWFREVDCPGCLAAMRAAAEKAETGGGGFWAWLSS